MADDASDLRDAAAQDNQAAAESRVAEALEKGAVRDAAELPEHLRHLPEQTQWLELRLKAQFAEQEYELRETYAMGIFVVLGLQLAIADGVFVAYAWVGKAWNLAPAVIDIWLAATVIQIVGVVMVVTRHLFPNRDNDGRRLKAKRRV